jgi:N-acetylglucosamine-6-phosphate deacetylase
MSTLIHNVRLISPDLDLPTGTLRIVEGRIEEVVEGGPGGRTADEVIDGGGRMVMPGFFDIHAHGADRRDVCDGDPEGLHHIARHKRREGVTTWLPTTLTQPRETLKSIAATVAGFMAGPTPVRCPGMHVEGPFINVDKAGAQNPQFVRPPDWRELAGLHEIAPVRIVSLAPDMPGAVELVAAASAAGIVCSAAHTAATCEQIFAARDAGLRHLTHFGNAMTPLHHREIGAVGAGLLDDGLMLELICDTIHLSPDMLRLMFKRVPVERLMMITDSMAASWIDRGEVTLGGLAVTVANGTARLKDGGALAGSALRYNHGVKHIAEITGLPLNQIVKATSWNQARSLGLEGFGRLETGYHADLVILDADFSVWKTMVAGEFD